MDWSVKKTANELVARVVSGPMQFRFLVQPAMAVCLGIRDGLKDARAGSPPFLRGLFFQPAGRKQYWREALRRIGIPVAIAILLDAIAQFIMFQHIRPLSALLVGALMMGLPYTAARDVANRVRSSRRPLKKRLAA
jgi:hypothetical protein